ncbi:MAG: Fe-S cluster assembly protein HesB [Planctomycetota bacterium]
MAVARIAAPEGFSLWATVRSHGWSDLPPFDTDRTGHTLVIRLGRAIATVTQEGAALRVALASRGALDAATRRAAIAAVRSCLRLDLDLSGFWEMCARDPELAWAAGAGAGRLLRAPTVFDDAVMTLATTNCSWALTRKITASLAERYGEGGALPTAARLCRARAQDLRRASLGYRAPYLAALARGKDLEGLRTDPRPTSEIRRALLELPGFGPYAAENMLRLLGRFEHLALDSWVLRTWKEKYPRRQATERAILRRVEPFGEWRGLAFWLLVTSHWYGREEWRDKF